MSKVVCPVEGGLVRPAVTRDHAIGALETAALVIERNEGRVLSSRTGRENAPRRADFVESFSFFLRSAMRSQISDAAYGGISMCKT